MRYLERERIGFWRRLRVAIRRIAESEDDELAYAYYAANEGARSYDRRRCSRAYALQAFPLYRERHVAHGIALIFKAVGLSPHGRLMRSTSRLAWNLLRYRASRLARAAA
jgi:hypothetical protein